MGQIAFFFAGILMFVCGNAYAIDGRAVAGSSAVRVGQSDHGARDRAELGRISKFDQLDSSSSARSVDETAVPVEAVLNAWYTISRGFNYGGYGDGEYYRRAALDAAQMGRCMGNQLVALGTEITDVVIGPRVRRLGRQLQGLSSAGAGDVDYWMAREENLNREVRDVGQSLQNLVGEAEGATVPRQAVTQAFVDFLKGFRNGGSGTAYFWLRACRDHGYVGRAVGTALTDLARDVSGADARRYRLVGRDLGSLNEGGEGDLDYWLQRATTMVANIHDLALELAGRDRCVMMARP